MSSSLHPAVRQAAVPPVARERETGLEAVTTRGRVRAAPTRRLSLAVGRAREKVVVSLLGEIDAPGALLLEHVLSDLIEDQGNMAVEIRLQGAQMVEPRAASVLRGAAESARRHGGEVTLLGSPAGLA